jgi:hypothetical protein
VHEFFVSRGAVERPTEGLLQDESFSSGEVIDQLQQGIYSATWSTDDRGRRRGAEAAREWVVREGHDLSDSFVVTRELSWHSYDLP